MHLKSMWYDISAEIIISSIISLFKSQQTSFNQSNKVTIKAIPNTALVTNSAICYSLSQ